VAVQYPVRPGWLYTRGMPSLEHNSGQWVELVVSHWRLGRQISNRFGGGGGITRHRIPMTTTVPRTTNEVPSPLTRL
jgi:hypothetical protein